jgi:hypothetical protein
MQDLVNQKKRASHHSVPCSEYVFGGVNRGISFCNACGFPGFDHDSKTTYTTPQTTGGGNGWLTQTRKEKA